MGRWARGLDSGFALKGYGDGLLMIKAANRTAYLDHLIQDATETRPGFAELWEPNAHMLKLSEERSRLGLSQAEVAFRMGVGRTAVVRMENDPSGVAFARILAYARALGVELILKPSKQKPKPTSRKRSRPVAA